MTKSLRAKHYLGNWTLSTYIAQSLGNVTKLMQVSHSRAGHSAVRKSEIFGKNPKSSDTYLRISVIGADSPKNSSENSEKKI